MCRCEHRPRLSNDYAGSLCRLFERLIAGCGHCELRNMAKYPRRIPQIPILVRSSMCLLFVRNIERKRQVRQRSSPKPYCPSLAPRNLGARPPNCCTTLKAIFTPGGRLVTLDKIPLGSTVRIVSLESSDSVTLRLMEMG